MARSKEKRAITDPKTKDYLVVNGVPMLPVEDFFPGCVVSPGQLMPEDVDQSKIIEAAELGMHDSQIAALVGLTTSTLLNHFTKTIRAARAGRALELLKLLNEKARSPDGKAMAIDFQSIEYLLGRQDPEPPKALPGPVIVPLPKELFNMSPDQLTQEINKARAQIPMATEVIEMESK